ncbi:hypothetical protein NDU88_005013 [Pleurodeles waltl]|uniref:Uncharacterized protein n=1 Tax=Pleurodeles waltl TaxID=8319 RepID=A0AAV7NQZ9_PLEWA|nr:hypothetical protein NDU88_005013 [Pleurodeles waltl]
MKAITKKTGEILWSVQWRHARRSTRLSTPDSCDPPDRAMEAHAQRHASVLTGVHFESKRTAHHAYIKTLKDLIYCEQDWLWSAHVNTKEMPPVSSVVGNEVRQQLFDFLEGKQFPHRTVAHDPERR